MTTTTRLTEDDVLQVAGGTLSLERAHEIFAVMQERLGEVLGSAITLLRDRTWVAQGSANAYAELAKPGLGPLAFRLSIHLTVLVVDEVCVAEALVFMFAGTTRLTGSEFDFTRFVFDPATENWRYEGPQVDVYGEWTSP